VAEYPRPIKKWNDVGHGGVPLPSYPNVDLIKVTEDSLEFGDPAGTFDVSTFKFEDMDRFSMFYKDNLYEKAHTNFVGNHPDIGPYLVSLELGTVEKLKCIVRSKKGNQRLLITPGKSGTLLQALINACPELKECNLLQVNNPDVQMDCLLFDQKLIASNYKFGVLLVKKDQPDEQSWYNNKDPTPAYEEFLEWLAFRVPMKAWPRFRGGLDSKNDLTGSESFYTNHKGYEIMLHCSAFIPYYPNDVQQVERKRHLGNDVVMIIFREADVTEPFDPAKVKSHFNHIFCVVQPVGTPENRSYMIAFSSKLGVQPYSPLLPAGGVYQRNDALREFLLTKLINSERAAMYAPDFKGKGINTRRAVLRDIVNKYIGEATKPQEKSGTPPMMHSASSPAATGKKEEKKGGMFSIFTRSASSLFGGHD
jgi:RAP1 GTPase activating protein 1